MTGSNRSYLPVEWEHRGSPPASRLRIDPSRLDSAAPTEMFDTELVVRSPSSRRAAGPALIVARARCGEDSTAALCFPVALDLGDHLEHDLVGTGTDAEQAGVAPVA